MSQNESVDNFIFVQVLLYQLQHTLTVNSCRHSPPKQKQLDKEWISVYVAVSYPAVVAATLCLQGNVLLLLI